MIPIAADPPIITGNRGSISWPSHMARKKPAKGEASTIAQTGLHNCLKSVVFLSSKTPNKGAIRNHEIIQGIKVLNIRVPAVVRV